MIRADIRALIADLFRGAHLRRIKRPTVDPLDAAIQAIESRIDRIDPAPVDPTPVDLDERGSE
jgi:hypothetical protein